MYQSALPMLQTKQNKFKQEEFTELNKHYF